MSEQSPAVTMVAQGRAALARYAWQEARASFEAALAQVTTPEALEGLANAAAFLYDGAGAIDAHEHAYRLYREAGDVLSAARMAVWLANDSLTFRGEAAVANGWLQRAHRLLDSCVPGPEHAFLAGMEAHLALMTRNDPAAALTHATEALRLARRFHLADIEALASAIEGLALVTQGSVVEGMSRLDEAAAAVLAGEVKDFDARGTALCYLIEACTRARDYDRAKQWCARVEQEFRRLGAEPLFAFCRPNLALVHMWLGMWQEAERSSCGRSRTWRPTCPPWLASPSSASRICAGGRDAGKRPQSFSSRWNTMA